MPTNSQRCGHSVRIISQMKNYILVLAIVLAIASVSFAFLPQKMNLGDDMGEPCAICEFVTQALEGYISSFSTEAEIMEFLTRACGLVQSPFTAQVRLCSLTSPSMFYWPLGLLFSTIFLFPVLLSAALLTSSICAFLSSSLSLNCTRIALVSPK